MLKSSVITSVLSVYLSTYVSRLKPSRFVYNLRKYCRLYLVILGNSWKAYVEMYNGSTLVKALFSHSDLMLKNLFFTQKRLKPKRSSRKFLCFHVLLESLHLIFPIFIAFLLKIKLFNFFKALNLRIRGLVLLPYLTKCIKPVSTSLFILKGVKPVVFLIVNKLFKILNLLLYVRVSPPLHYIYMCLQYVFFCFQLNIYRLEVRVDA